MMKEKPKRDPTFPFKKLFIAFVVMTGLGILILLGFGQWWRNAIKTETDLTTSETTRLITSYVENPLSDDLTNVHGVRVSYWLDSISYVSFELSTESVDDFVAALELPCDLELEAQNAINMPSVGRDWWRPQSAESFRAGQCETAGRSLVYSLWLDETDPTTTVIYMVEDIND